MVLRQKFTSVLATPQSFTKCLLPSLVKQVDVVHYPFPVLDTRKADSFFTTVDASVPLQDHIRDLTNGHGVDVCITACPVPQVQTTALELTAINGRVLFFGGLPADKANVNLNTNLIHYKQLLVTGTTRSSLAQFRTTVQLIANGLIEVKDLITSRSPLEGIQETIENVRKALSNNTPILGICLGSQILGLAAGTDTYKLKYGHRSQNQPCVETGTKRCYITVQNHGYAIDADPLPEDWREWFYNDNDKTNEGIIHISKPFFGAQFHPEASPGPDDTEFLFDMFLRAM